MATRGNGGQQIGVASRHVACVIFGALVSRLAWAKRVSDAALTRHAVGLAHVVTADAVCGILVLVWVPEGVALTRLEEFFTEPAVEDN